MGVRMRFTRISTGGAGSHGVVDVRPMPKGNTRQIGNGATNTGGYTDIVSYTVPDGKTFSLSKIIVAWEGGDEQEVVLKMGGEIISEYFSTAYVMDWFPPGVDLEGDGTKTVLIQAKAPSSSVGAQLLGFIEGELT